MNGGPSRAEIHLHTTASDGSMTPEEAVRLARRLGLAALAVTDHDTFRGSSLASRASRILGGPPVVHGNEVRTDHGDILVYCPEPHPATPKVLDDLVDWARERSCITVAAHPYHPGRMSIGRALSRYIDRLDAVEVWNSRGIPLLNLPAIRAAEKYGKPGTSGSDAHVPQEVATAPVILPEPPRGPEDVIEWIRKGKVRPTLGLPRLRAIPWIIAWSMARRL